MNTDTLFLSFYGDDFTGSTDVMESLTMNGVQSVLFLSPPTAEEVNKFELKKSWEETGNKKIGAFGVAGVSRSMFTEKMERELPPIFEKISAIPAKFFHYKVCSTFDSSPKIGNIGTAVDIALRYFPTDNIPLLIAAPPLNRFSIFGNLFARIDGVTYRLDRHPTMSKHPVTPMKESDLRLHLAGQTERKVNLFDLFDLDSPPEIQEERLAEMNTRRSEFILFDTYHEGHLTTVGKLIYEHSSSSNQLLVGSSGIEYALTGYLQETGKIQKPVGYSTPGSAEKIIVMAGSAAPTTKLQLERMIEKGGKDIRIDTPSLVDPSLKEKVIEETVREALNCLERNISPVIYTALGPDDPWIERTNDKIRSLGITDMSNSELIAGVQGLILKRILQRAGKIRSVVAGGDTSGHVARALGIFALEVLVPIAPGAPLCLAHSKDPAFDGLEISLKGGQNGKRRYFESILAGRLLD